MGVTTHLWQVWPGRHWPLCRDEEKTFVSDLRAGSTRGTAEDWDRGDVTSVLNALRCGLDAVALAEVGPGLKFGRLLGAYEFLDERRAAAITAWEHLLERQDPLDLIEYGPTAARLIPTPVYQLSEASQGQTREPLSVILANARALTRELSRHVLEVEDAMCTAGHAGHDDEAIALGCTLYHPYQQGLWGHPYYLTSRVGALTPSRVSDLLDEELGG